MSIVRTVYRATVYGKTTSTQNTSFLNRPNLRQTEQNDRIYFLKWSL